jgi:gliding motility-associatede transport system auxiliary component
MTNQVPPSFSRLQKWSLSLNVVISVLAVLALVLMVNYLAARHFKRLSLSSNAEAELSPLTRRVLGTVTNEIKIIIYFDKQEPVYDSVWSLLKEYKFANAKITVEAVDYLRDPAAANLVKVAYKLSQATDKNLIIFDCNGSKRYVYGNELSDVDIQSLVSGKTNEVRRTHFKGELLFTSAILSVSNPRPVKAYFLSGHGEHRPTSDDKLMGYSKFAGVLRENNVRFEQLNLLVTAEVPADCQLLIIAGPREAIPQDELEKVERYLKQGGRLLALFNNDTATKTTGLEKTLANWGVAVGKNVVTDEKNTLTGLDVFVSQFSNHPLVQPLNESRLRLFLPRSIAKGSTGLPNAEAPQVEVLAVTGPEGRVITDIRNGALYPSVNNFTGAVPLMVAVEKGTIRGVSADRGSTRIVVVGESIFLGNEAIDQVANHDFASHSINWLLARNELLGTLGPHPIKDYKLTMTTSQLATVRWILMLAMPGSVLLVGLLVSASRRR